jgi:hypothetical protein
MESMRYCVVCYDENWNIVEAVCRYGLTLHECAVHMTEWSVRRSAFKHAGGSKGSPFAEVLIFEIQETNDGR